MWDSENLQISLIDLFLTATCKSRCNQSHSSQNTKEKPQTRKLITIVVGCLVFSQLIGLDP